MHTKTERSEVTTAPESAYKSQKVGFVDKREAGASFTSLLNGTTNSGTRVNLFQRMAEQASTPVQDHHDKSCCCPSCNSGRQVVQRRKVESTSSTVVQLACTCGKTPHDPSCDEYKKPLYTSKSKKGGSSKHFPNTKLPKRLTRKKAASKLPDARSKRIYLQTERSGVPSKTQKALIEKAKKEKSAKKQMTSNAKKMTKKNASLSSTSTSQNHIFSSESSLLVQSVNLNTITSSTASKSEKADAREQSKKVADALVGPNKKKRKKIHQYIDDIDSGDDTDDAVEHVQNITKMSADDPNNVQLGNSGQNSAMSNRVDVTTSPGRTSMDQQSAQILNDLDEPIHEILDDDAFADELMSVPLSPKGQHILSSKKLED